MVIAQRREWWSSKLSFSWHTTHSETQLSYQRKGPLTWYSRIHIFKWTQWKIFWAPANQNSMKPCWGHKYSKPVDTLWTRTVHRISLFHQDSKDMKIYRASRQSSLKTKRMTHNGVCAVLYTVGSTQIESTQIGLYWLIGYTYLNL